MLSLETLPQELADFIDVDLSRNDILALRETSRVLNQLFRLVRFREIHISDRRGLPELLDHLKPIEEANSIDNNASITSLIQLWKSEDQLKWTRSPRKRKYLKHIHLSFQDFSHENYTAKVQSILAALPTVEIHLTLSHDQWLEFKYGRRAPDRVSRKLTSLAIHLPATTCFLKSEFSSFESDFYIEEFPDLKAAEWRQNAAPADFERSPRKKNNYSDCDGDRDQYTPPPPSSSPSHSTPSTSNSISPTSAPAAEAAEAPKATITCSSLIRCTTQPTRYSFTNLTLTNANLTGQSYKTRIYNMTSAPCFTMRNCTLTKRSLREVLTSATGSLSFRRGAQGTGVGLLDPILPEDPHRDVVMQRTRCHCLSLMMPMDLGQTFDLLTDKLCIHALEVACTRDEGPESIMRFAGLTKVRRVIVKSGFCQRKNSKKNPVRNATLEEAVNVLKKVRASVAYYQLSGEQGRMEVRGEVNVVWYVGDLSVGECFRVSNGEASEVGLNTLVEHMEQGIVRDLEGQTLMLNKCG